MGVRKEVSPSMMYNFLTIGYTSNPYNTQETFYEDIRSLPAASFLIFSLASQTVTVEKFWQPFINVDEKASESETVDKFTYLFLNSIQKRLRSNVAIGNSLSVARSHTIWQKITGTKRRIKQMGNQPKNKAK